MTASGRIVVLTAWGRMWSMGAGGTPSEAYLLEGLLGAGHTVDLVAPPDEVDDFPRHPGLRVHRMPALAAPGRFVRQRGWLSLSQRLTGTARALVGATGRPDVVYGLSSLATPAAALCGRMWRRPSVGKLYGTFLLPAVGNPLRLAQQWEEVLAFRSPVTRLVVHDDGTGGDIVARSLRVPAERLRFWRNGVDREACEAARRDADPDGLRAEYGLAHDAPLIYTASRIVRWKRVDRIVRAMPGVLRREPAARLVVAGDGSERPELEQLAAELGVDGAVTFAGGVPRERNLRLMAVADAFCATYEYSNVGNALQEAMSCGAPVVVTDSGRTRDLVRHGRNGLVVAGDDGAGLGDAIVRLLGDGELRRQLGEAARADAAAELPTKEARAALEVALTGELIGAGRAARR